MKYLFFISMLGVVLCNIHVSAHENPYYIGGKIVEHYTEAHSEGGIPCHVHILADGRRLEWDDPSFTLGEKKETVPEIEPEIEPSVTVETTVDPPVTVTPPAVVETTPDPVSEPITGTPIEDGGFPSVVEERAMDTQQGISAPPVSVVVVEKPKAPPANIVLTQVMFHDWGALGGRNQPQWFELHNRGGDANLEGYTLTFQVRTKDFGVYEEEVIILKDFQLPAGETMIVTRRRVGKFLGHLWGYTEGVAYIYIDEAIPNLKNRWVLTDSEGKELYRRDARWNWGWGPHENRERKAVDVVPSEVYTGEDKRYYGSCFDRGNPPGWHVDVIPKAPQLRRPKRVGTWGELKGIGVGNPSHSWD